MEVEVSQLSSPQIASGRKPASRSRLRRRSFILAIAGRAGKTACESGPESPAVCSIFHPSLPPLKIPPRPCNPAFPLARSTIAGRNFLSKRSRLCRNRSRPPPRLTPLEKAGGFAPHDLHPFGQTRLLVVTGAAPAVGQVSGTPRTRPLSRSARLRNTGGSGDRHRRPQFPRPAAICWLRAPGASKTSGSMSEKLLKAPLLAGRSREPEVGDSDSAWRANHGGPRVAPGRGTQRTQALHHARPHGDVPRGVAATGRPLRVAGNQRPFLVDRAERHRVRKVPTCGLGE